MNIPDDFRPHFRRTPVTDAWEPLYSRLREQGVDLLIQVREPHCNGRGLLHGGVLACLCDNAMGLSLGKALANPSASIVTIHLALDYLGSARIGDIVTIEPRVLRTGSTIGFCDALVKAGETTIARANANFSVRIPEQAA